jgi:dUTPase
MLRYILEDPQAKPPARICKDAIALDLFAPSDFTILGGEKVQLNLGVSFKLPAGVAGLLILRESVAKRYNLQLTQTIIGEMLFCLKKMF